MISGKGSLIIGSMTAATGTLMLTGANTYTGGDDDQFPCATLQVIGNGFTTGSITGNVTDNGSLIFDRSDSITFAGNITGTGSVTFNYGVGTVTLTGTGSTYSGGTTINAGVSINNGSALGTGKVTINNVGALLATANLTPLNEVDFIYNLPTPPFPPSRAPRLFPRLPGTHSLTLRTVVFGTGVLMRCLAARAIRELSSSGQLFLGTVDTPAVTTIEVAFGTFAQWRCVSSGLGFFTSSVASTTVDKGATLDVHDFNMEVTNLLVRSAR